jgi:hypothetical protein
MRQIEKAMIEAIHFNHGMTQGNTAVIHGPVGELRS